MNFQEYTVQIFDSSYEKLRPFHSLIQNRTVTIAYSGGKDSTLLAYFYRYLFLQGKCPEPILFHLDHSIRDNPLQEEDIQLEMKHFSSKISIKKKTFQSFPNG